MEKTICSLTTVNITNFTRIKQRFILQSGDAY